MKNTEDLLQTNRKWNCFTVNVCIAL